MGTHADNFLAWIKEQTDHEDPDTMVWCWSNETKFLEPDLVSSQELDRTRWMMICENVYQFKDGSLVSATWQDGLTEYQDTDYADTEWARVEEVVETVTVTKYRRV